jgi:hypothetical protein
VTKGLEDLMEKNRKANSLRVDCEPIVSALIDATGIHSWSIMRPEGPNAWTSEFRYDKVFKYVPTLNVILALATPEEHAQAERNLRESGLWMEPETRKEGHNPQGGANGRQPFNSETNPASAAAAPRRSP